jgi:deoxyribose-phosphate aldolase
MLTNKELFQFLDLTSLNATDTSTGIEQLAKSAISFSENGYRAAAVCVFPQYAALVSAILENTGIQTAVVGACFPASQSFEAVKILECSMAVKSGAQEVDIVINLGALYNNEDQRVISEISAVKDAINPACLKVIIESGLLDQKTLIQRATRLAIIGGADFVKTSTGKVNIGATPDAVEAMCSTIKEHLDATGDRIGIKISGGVKTKSEAIMYYNLVRNCLGADQMHPDYFRIGASSLASDLMNE